MAAAPITSYRPPVGATCSQAHRDVTEDRYRDLRRPRRLLFYCNGDRYFAGKQLHVTPHRYLGIADLLGDLTAKMPPAASTQLPYGVRRIFTPVGGTVIGEIEQLQDGGSYVCAGFEPFRRVRYGMRTLQPWNNRKPHYHPSSNDDYGSDNFAPPAFTRGYYGAFHPSRPLRGGAAGRMGGGARPAIMRPRVITVVRVGKAAGDSSVSHDTVKILLNRGSVQSYDQLLRDISEAFGPRWRSSRVQCLYNLRGRQLRSAADFFRDDDVFVADSGGDAPCHDDMRSLLAALYPQSSHARSLLRQWDRAQKRREAKHKQLDPGGKRDSGLGSDDGVEQQRGRRGDDGGRRSKGGIDGIAGRDRQKHAGDGQQKYGGGGWATDGPAGGVKSHDGTPGRQKVGAHDDALRMERERLRAAEDERERAHELLQQRQDSERRALREQRRNLVPAKPTIDPLRRKPPRRRPLRTASPAHSATPDTKYIIVVKGEDGSEDGAKDHRGGEHRGRESVNDGPLSTRHGRESVNNARNKPENDVGAGDKENRGDGKGRKDLRGDTTGKEDVDGGKGDGAKTERKKPAAKVVYRTKLERQVSNPEHILAKYQLGKTLGDGNFAVVKQAKLKKTDQDFAMKIIEKSKLRGKQHMVDNEIAVMKSCQHPSIVRLVEEYETNDQIYLVMELVKGGDLFDAITQSVKFNETDSAGMVSDLASALFYLHSRSIVHRDLKPENLLVCRNKDSSISLKLADFGLAMEVTEPIYTVCGTPTYVAPEILSEIGYGIEVDIWALGVITYILLCGFPPFRSPDRNQTELFEFIKAGEYEFLAPYWDMISEEAKDLIRMMIVVDVKKRCTAADVLCHPWIINRGKKGAMSPQKMEERRRELRKQLNAQHEAGKQERQRC